MKQGQLFIISGPSGVGKGTIIKEILKDSDVHLAVSATTRAPRQNETHKADYYFLSKEQFQNHLDQGEFLEWNEVHGNRYGTLKSEIENAFSKQKTHY